MKLEKAQIEAAVGLFQRMNEQQLDVDPAVFTMFGLLLGAVRRQKSLLKNPRTPRTGDGCSYLRSVCGVCSEAGTP